MDFESEDQMNALADKILALEETLNVRCGMLETRCATAEARCNAMEKRCAKAEALLAQIQTPSLTPVRRASIDIEPSLLEVAPAAKRTKRPSTAVTPTSASRKGRGRPIRAARMDVVASAGNTTSTRKKSSARKKTPNFPTFLSSDDETIEDVEPVNDSGRPTRSAAMKQKTPTKSKTAVTPKPPVVAEPQPVAGPELIGKCIWISWPNNGSKYKSLVVGFSKSEDKHKVFYIDDETTETMVLKDRTWNVVEEGEVPWPETSLCGKKLYVMWNGFYEDEEDQKKAREKYGTEKDDETKIPYEAFIIKQLPNGEHSLLYTYDDNLEKRDLSKESEDWKLADLQSTDAEGLPYIMWTGDDDEE